MNYLLKENFELRGWKNRPFCLCDRESPANPFEIREELMHLLSGPILGTPENPAVKELVKLGIIRPAKEGEELKESQKYYNYGCLYFESVIFSITGKCNYKCLHCSVNAPKSPLKEIPFDKITRQLDEMKECGLKNIVLIGGEPLIRKDFLQIVDAVLARNMFVVEIFTNGSLIDEKLLDALSERKVFPLFMVSFDGVGFHDTMRGVKGAEEKFYQSLNLLRQKGFPVACNMCVTKDSISSLWDTIVTLKERGVISLTVYPPVECGLWKDHYQEMGATLAQVAEVYQDVIEKYVAADYPLDLTLYGLAYFAARQKRYIFIPNWKYKPEEAAFSPACRVFRKELNISPEGVLSPCYAIMSDDYIREHMPNINSMPLKEALTDSPYTRIMELTAKDIADHNPKCRNCEHLPMCAGGCRMSAFVKTGDMLGYDPQMCALFENHYLDGFREAIKRGRQKRPGNSLMDFMKIFQ